MRAPSSDAPGRILVAAVGLPWMRDLGFGSRVLERLRTRALPTIVDLEDWSFGTITAFQRLSERRYARAILLAATPRDRPTGTLHRTVAPAALPQADEIHARIGDGVMGSISVDNLIVLARCYDALPADTVLLEVEPADDGWGDELSPAVAPLVDEAVALVLHEVRRAPAPPLVPGGPR